MILGLFAPVGLSPASRVVQAEDLNTGLLQVIVAMVSSNLALADHPSRVTVRLNDPLLSRPPWSLVEKHGLSAVA